MIKVIDNQSEKYKMLFSVKDGNKIIAKDVKGYNVDAEKFADGRANSPTYAYFKVEQKTKTGSVMYWFCGEKSELINVIIENYNN